MDNRQIAVVIGLTAVALIAIVALVVAFSSLIVKKPIQKKKGVFTILIALSGIYNFVDVLTRYKYLF